MILAEPQATQWDVRFNVGTIPVRIHPFFWLVAIMLGAVSRGPHHIVVSILLWTAAMFVSLLVHELGHAFIAKAYGWPPKVVLYTMGGLAIYTPGRQTRASRILIAFAGPGAGFILGGLVLGGVLLSGHSVQLPGLPIVIGNGPPLTGGGRLELFVFDLLLFNIFWGLINLAPVQPLDGGTIAEAIIQRFRPKDSTRISLLVSIGSAIALAVVGAIFYRSFFIAVMFGFLAYSSWNMLQQLQGHTSRMH